MKLKIVFSFAVLVFLFFFTAAPTNASLVVIDKEGRVVINVLSAEESIELEIPSSEFFEIKNVVSETPEQDAKISLAKVDGKEVEVESVKPFKSTD